MNRQTIFNEVIQLLESQIQAKQLEALNDIETVASDYRALGFNPDYQKMIKAWKLDHSVPKYQLPGFENTMSDLDKLTVKPANEEEKT